MPNYPIDVPIGTRVKFRPEAVADGTEFHDLISSDIVFVILDIRPENEWDRGYPCYTLAVENYLSAIVEVPVYAYDLLLV